jgi:hypothetical protein
LMQNLRTYRFQKMNFLAAEFALMKKALITFLSLLANVLGQ